jgi:excisionase family DNA binding protein
MSGAATAEVLASIQATTTVEWFTVPGSAQTTQLCATTIRRAILAGELRAVKIGNVWRIRRDWLNFWLEHPPQRTLSAEAVEAQKLRNRKAVRARWEKEKERRRRSA